jgi:hypothetical protein
MADIDQVVMTYSASIFRAFGNKPEEDVKQDITPAMLRKEFSIEPSSETIHQTDEPRSPQNRAILRCKTPFVVVLNDGKPEKVIDRVQMASRIAVEALDTA